MGDGDAFSQLLCCSSESVWLGTDSKTGASLAVGRGRVKHIAPQEKTPLAHTVRTCQQLLKVEPALWTFVTTVGVEPTNNAAERALRPAVLWRKNSFGSSL